MMYPPKKKAYSPENKKTKDLSSLHNINSKFIGTGGSNFISSSRNLLISTQKTALPPQTPSLRNI